MANTFIPKGQAERDAPQIPAPRGEKKLVPGFLYHSTAPNGKCVYELEEWTRLQRLGWVDNPLKTDRTAEAQAEADEAARPEREARARADEEARETKIAAQAQADAQALYQADVEAGVAAGLKDEKERFEADLQAGIEAGLQDEKALFVVFKERFEADKKKYMATAKSEIDQLTARIGTLEKAASEAKAGAKNIEQDRHVGARDDQAPKEKLKKKQ